MNHFLSIRKSPHEKRVSNSNCMNSLFLLLHPFADLIIGETDDTPSPDFFFQVYIALPMPKGTDNQDNNTQSR